MIYINRISVTESDYPGTDVFPENLDIQCRDLNLIVGDQGTGKSTLLGMLYSNHDSLVLELSTSGVDSMFFDTERHNPRVADISNYSTPSGHSKGIGIGGAIQARFKSHGEVMERFIIGALEQASEVVIILDEPEAGLSIRNQYRLVDSINGAVGRGCQIFMATHCVPVISSFDVFLISDCKWMGGLEYIESITDGK